MAEQFSQPSKLFGLTININKTEVLYQPAPNTNSQEPTITIDGTCLKNIDSFKYLGSIISNDGYLDKESASRISKANQSLGRTQTRVLNQHNICLSTKLKVYSAVVLNSLLYGRKTWMLYHTQIKQLEKFLMHAYVLS